jgi:hypothetical protein
MKPLSTRNLVIGMVIISIVVIGAALTFLPGRSPAPTAALPERVSGQAADVVNTVQLPAPALPEASRLGDGWSHVGDGDDVESFGLPGCLFSIPDKTGVASASYTGPGGVTVTTVSTTQAVTTLNPWFGAASNISDYCTGSLQNPVRELPGVQDEPNIAGASVGTTGSWMVMRDQETNHGVAVYVTFSGDVNTTDYLWSADVAKAAMAAANGQEYGPLAPVGETGLRFIPVPVKPQPTRSFDEETSETDTAGESEKGKAPQAPAGSGDLGP